MGSKAYVRRPQRWAPFLLHWSAAPACATLAYQQPYCFECFSSLKYDFQHALRPGTWGLCLVMNSWQLPTTAKHLAALPMRTLAQGLRLLSKLPLPIGDIHHPVSPKAAGS